jgi:zinc and cadmium transporter
MAEVIVAWVYALASVLAVSAVSLIGILSVIIGKKRMSGTLLFLISFSAGSLLGGAFLHLLPEAYAGIGDPLIIGGALLSGTMMFFVLEKFVHWRHCHVPTSADHPHPFAYMNLVGDSLHNFIDGLVIGVSYLVSVPLGLATTFVIILHEIPQELGDFGVLIHGGFKRKKALMLNFVTALTAVVGTVIGLLLGSSAESLSILVIPFTAGGFIYIAGSDLIPEMHKESKAARSLLQFIGIMAGILLMAAFVGMG